MDRIYRMPQKHDHWGQALRLVGFLGVSVQRAVTADYHRKPSEAHPDRSATRHGRWLRLVRLH